MKKIARQVLYFLLLLCGHGLSAETAVPAMIVLAEPVNMEQQVSFTESVYWRTDELAESYHLQISSDIGFVNLEVDSMVMDTSFLYLGYLEASTTYFWRVSGKNICGDGDFSEIWRFTIGKVVESCLQVSYSSDPFPIEDEDTTQIELNISAPGLVTSVRVVNVDIDHPSISDVALQLISPQGTAVSLVENICSASSGMNMGFVDGASSNIPCPPTTTESYQPFEALAAYSDTRARGQWNLWVADDVQQTKVG